MDRLFSPKTIAVVGASPNPDKIGNVLLRNLAGFAGHVYPVHPSASEVLGQRAYSTVSAIPEPVDLALLAIPQEAVVSAIKDCAAAGVGGAVVFSGGWAESGDTGARSQREMLSISRAAGVRILGPNTSGFVIPKSGQFCTFVADLPQKLQPGQLSIIAQSGGVNLSLCFLAQNEGLGVRLGLGLGNACDVSWPEALDWLIDDSETKVVALAIEGVADGRGLIAAVRRLTDKCPVVALTVGRTDVSAFAKSHTGVLTGSYRVKRAALAQAGAVVVDDMTELIDAVQALGATRLSPSQNPGVGVVTGQAGPGLLLTDALKSRGVMLPTLSQSTQSHLSKLLPPLTYQENPVDTGRPSKTFGEVLKTIRRSEGIDMLAVSLLHEPDAVNPGEVLGDVTPCVLCSLGPEDSVTEIKNSLKSKNVAVFPTPERTASAVAALTADSKQQSIRKQTQPSGKKTQIATFSPPAGQWDEVSGKELLEELGIRTPVRVVCENHAEAHLAMAKLGQPLAVKVLHHEVAHKTDAGGVHLNVKTSTELDKALNTIDRTSGARYLLEQMVESGPELLVGARRDPSFGPLIVLGSGGIAAETEDDVAIRLAPLSVLEASAMLGNLRSVALYRGFRGSRKVDEQQLADVLVLLSQLIVGRDDILEIEINPLRMTADGLVALDALVVAR